MIIHFGIRETRLFYPIRDNVFVYRFFATDDFIPSDEGCSGPSSQAIRRFASQGESENLRGVRSFIEQNAPELLNQNQTPERSTAENVVDQPASSFSSLAESHTESSLMVEGEQQVPQSGTPLSSSSEEQVLDVPPPLSGWQLMLLRFRNGWRAVMHADQRGLAVFLQQPGVFPNTNPPTPMATEEAPRYALEMEARLRLEMREAVARVRFEVRDTARRQRRDFRSSLRRLEQTLFSRYSRGTQALSNISAVITITTTVAATTGLWVYFSIGPENRMAINRYLQEVLDRNEPLD